MLHATQGSFYLSLICALKIHLNETKLDAGLRKMCLRERDTFAAQNFSLPSWTMCFQLVHNTQPMMWERNCLHTVKGCHPDSKSNVLMVLLVDFTHPISENTKSTLPGLASLVFHWISLQKNCSAQLWKTRQRRHFHCMWNPTMLLMLENQSQKKIWTCNVGSSCNYPPKMQCDSENGDRIYIRMILTLSTGMLDFSWSVQCPLIAQWVSRLSQHSANNRMQILFHTVHCVECLLLTRSALGVTANESTNMHPSWQISINAASIGKGISLDPPVMSNVCLANAHAGLRCVAGAGSYFWCWVWDQSGVLSSLCLAYWEAARGDCTSPAPPCYQPSSTSQRPRLFTPIWIHSAIWDVKMDMISNDRQLSDPYQTLQPQSFLLEKYWCQMQRVVHAERSQQVTWQKAEPRPICPVQIHSPDY